MTAPRFAPILPAAPAAVSRSRRRLLLGAVMLAGLLAAGCAKPGPPRRHFADITFSNSPSSISR
ncbi:MAG: hypothetical protein WDO24_31490 [Pseudomonadota bacterium]